MVKEPRVLLRMFVKLRSATLGMGDLREPDFCLGGLVILRPLATFRVVSLGAGERGACTPGLIGMAARFTYSRMLATWAYRHSVWRLMPV